MGPDNHLHVGMHGNLRVQVASARFAALVIDDLCAVDDAPGGGALLAELDALGRLVVIARPDAPHEPPNGTVELLDAMAGKAGGGSRILYDPAEWPWLGDPACPDGAKVLLALLRQASANARGCDDPTDVRACLAMGG